MATISPSKGHRHSKSAALPPATSTASSQNPQNPYHKNSRAHATNSESDTNYSNQPSTPPRTPRKETRPPHVKSHSTPHETGSKQKPRNKRPKNVMTSPAVVRNDRNSPPLTGAASARMPSSAKPISTPLTAAYAGSTFHASPAPSALPIPSFYSKSVPDSPSLRGIRSSEEYSVPESPSRVSAPVSKSQLQREASPLDLFFKADREEKARARSASSTQASLSATGPFQPPPESSQSDQTSPAPSSQHRPRNSKRMSSNGMFAIELDGESSAGSPYGPAFSTPYSERINAARIAALPQQPTQTTARQTMTSEALKAYLFSGHESPSPVASSTGPGGEQRTPIQSPAVNPSQKNMSSQPCGLQTVQGSTWSQSSQVFSQDTITPSINSRTSGRSSGLRQEVPQTRTPSKAFNSSANYANPPTPSRMYENSTTINSNHFISTFIPHTASPVPTSSYGISSGNKHADIQGMEESLRKILKLDSNPGVTGSTVGGSNSSVNASEQKYIGGRAPPMNGIHNGVMGSR